MVLHTAYYFIVTEQHIGGMSRELELAELDVAAAARRVLEPHRPPPLSAPAAGTRRVLGIPSAAMPCTCHCPRAAAPLFP